MQEEIIHQQYMQRAWQLAALGQGRVSPNPVVGCVIVHDGKIIGEGYHERYGEGHAEVNAIASVANPALLAQASLYVTLEPCSHFGKTPPCADLIIQHNIPKVYVCNLDPNPLVAGKGIEKLQNAGIEVHHGILALQGRWLNRRFFTFMEQKRPHVILKWAQTADGFVAQENYDSKWISNWRSRKQVHKMRAQEDAIMVGTNTAHYDNPKLNVRSWTGEDPTRVVLDLHQRLSPDLALFDGSIPTIAYTYGHSQSEENVEWRSLEVGKPLLPQILNDLYRQKIQSLIVEGGSRLLQAFIEQGLWDEAQVFTGKRQFGTGIAAPKLQGVCVKEEQLLGDVLRLYRPLATQDLPIS